MLDVGQFNAQASALRAAMKNAAELGERLADPLQPGRNERNSKTRPAALPRFDAMRENA